MKKTKEKKRIRVLEEQRRRDRKRLLFVKKQLKPVNKVLEQVKPLQDLREKEIKVEQKLKE